MRNGEGLPVGARERSWTDTTAGFFHHLNLVGILILQYEKGRPRMGPDEQADEFGEALERLRSTGKALLVVGAVPDAIHRQTCGELLGNGGAGRLLIRTGRSQTAAVAPTDADRVVEYESGPRSAASATTEPSEPGGTGTLSGDFSGTNTTTVSTLAAAGRAVEDGLAALDAERTPPRVCIDSVMPLVDTAGEEETFSFLHTVTSRVRNLGGTCHFHLSLPPESVTARTFDSLVEATVELRLVDDRAEQRWRVHDAGVASDWLPMDTE
jgi:hypothetical protein